MRSNRLIYLLLLTILTDFVACKEAPQEHTHEAAASYTCPMHPQIVENTPGTCPICGMDLVLFDRTDSSKSILLDARQRTLANIHTMTVGDSSINASKKLNARVVTDPGNAEVITSRIPGRIVSLAVRETGVKVTKGQLLYSIYSEQLEALQQEYLVAAAQKREFPNDEQFARIEKAARQKLILFGQTGQQVDRLLNTDKPDALSHYYSPASGIVAEVIATEGAYVEEGGVILRLDGLDEVWIEADIYSSEKSSVATGKIVQVQVEGSRSFEPMKIEFISPSLQEGSQITTIRGRLPNNGGNLIPGMQATVLISIKGGGDATKVIPVEAVIRDSHGAHVWVETSTNKFEPRIVSTGKEDARQSEIINGIENGDKVVVSGAYLLYSEYVLKKGNQPVTHTNH